MVESEVLPADHAGCLAVDEGGRRDLVRAECRRVWRAAEPPPRAGPYEVMVLSWPDLLEARVSPR